VDLWSARGKLPHNLLDVAERQKDIQYSSRTRAITDYMREQQNYRRMLERGDGAGAAVKARRPVVQARSRPCLRRTPQRDPADLSRQVVRRQRQGLPVRRADDARALVQRPRGYPRHAQASALAGHAGAGRPFVTHDVHRGNGGTTDPVAYSTVTLASSGLGGG
jgi:NTE family protein